MGQYYRPSVLRKNWKTAKNPVIASLLCYDFDNGAKLMEHSYVSTWLSRSVEYLLANQFKGYPFVWAGDYADEVETKTGKHDIYTDAERFIYKDYDSDSNVKSKAYVRLRASIPVMYQGEEWSLNKEDDFNPYMNYPYYRYLVNFTKKEYCIMPKYSKKEWRINPLPLLTCSDNGGGGSYGRDDNRVGSWAYDCIGMTNDKKEVEGFTQISGVFKLDR